MSHKQDIESEHLQEYLRLMHRHQNIIFRVCKIYAPTDMFIHDDLQQEVAIAVWKEVGKHGISRLRDKECEAAWMYRIAVNTVISYIKHYIFPHNILPLDDDEANKLLPEESCEKMEEIRELMEFLPARDQRILDRYLDGYSYAQIGEAEHLSLTAVSSRLYRVTQKLKQMHDNQSSRFSSPTKEEEAKKHIK